MCWEVWYGTSVLARNLRFAGNELGRCTVQSVSDILQRAWTEDIGYPPVRHKIAVVKHGSDWACPMFEAMAPTGILDISPTSGVITLTDQHFCSIACAGAAQGCFLG